MVQLNKEGGMLGESRGLFHDALGDELSREDNDGKINTSISRCSHQRFSFWRSAGVLPREFTGRPAPCCFERRDAVQTRSRDGWYPFTARNL